MVCVRVADAAQAAGLARGPHAEGLVRLTAREVVVTSGTDTLPAGVDGEHVVLPSPVVCRIEPGVLRVRVPRRRRALRPRAAVTDWPRVVRLALGSGPGRADGDGAGGRWC